MSPQSPGPENFPSNNYDVAAQLRKKELFAQRKQREFIPDAKKDDSYWDRRRRNNEAAKRSREKRRFNDMVLEQRVVELTKENHVLKAQLEAIKDKYNICGENLVSVDQIMATLPTSEQVLSITKRTKLSHSVSPQRDNSYMGYPSSPSPVPTSVIHQNINASVSCSPPQSQSIAISQSPPQNATLLHHPHIAVAAAPAPASGCATTTSTPPSGISPPSIAHHHHHYAARPQHPVSPPPPREEHEPMDYQPHHQLLPLHHHHHHYAAYQDRAAHYTHTNGNNGASVLNLSRRAHSPYEVSSGGSVASVDEEHDTHETPNNNSLPLKLRHKSHLGDKDAASALLALHNIKQEPNPRLSPPWDGEGSSDERDSGISIGAPEWTAAIQRKIIVPTAEPSLQDKEEENIHLKSQLARLESEVATIKNMMILNTAAGATAAAQ